MEYLLYFLKRLCLNGTDKQQEVYNTNTNPLSHLTVNVFKNVGDCGLMFMNRLY